MKSRQWHEDMAEKKLSRSYFGTYGEKMPKCFVIDNSGKKTMFYPPHESQDRITAEERTINTLLEPQMFYLKQKLSCPYLVNRHSHLGIF